MSIHIPKGVTLVIALVGPVFCALFCHWRLTVLARHQKQVR